MNRRTCDEAIVSDILTQDGEGHNGELTSLLLELRSFAHASPPAPSTELADLMQGHDHDQGVVDLNSRRWTGRRAALLSITVIATMGLGVAAAAAASPDFRTVTQHAITALIEPSTGTHDPERPVTPVRQPGSSTPPDTAPHTVPTLAPKPSTPQKTTEPPNKIVHAPGSATNPKENAATPPPLQEPPRPATPSQEPSRPETPSQNPDRPALPSQEPSGQPPANIGHRP